MARISAARVKCPRPGHGGSRVKLDGTYGKAGHRRQHYKCSPKGDKPDVFTELLPREESWHGSAITANGGSSAARARRPTDMPHTTAALEQLTRPISAALYPRRSALKNRERLNRL